MTKPRVLRIFAGLFLFLILFFCSSGAGRAQTVGSQPGNPLNAIGWLIGKWTAVEQGPDGIAVTIQLEAQWSDNHTAMQVSSTRIPAGGTPTLQYRGTFRWDPQRKKIVMTRIDANGDRFEGEAEPAGDDFDLTGSLTRADGSVQRLRYFYNSWSPGTFALEVSSQEQRVLGTAVNPFLVFLRQRSSPNSGNIAGAKGESSSRMVDSLNPASVSSISDGGAVSRV
jgi:hypothetical protein